MAFSKRLTLGVLLPLLLGAMFALLIAALALPTWSAIEQQRQAAQVVDVARAGQNVFTALQYLRPERGTVMAAVGAPEPAEATLLANLMALRSKGAPALDAVLRDCVALRCASDDPRLDGLRSSIERLVAVRRDADAALRQPRTERPPGLSASWDTTISDVTTRLDRLSAALTERVRMVDAPIAELMAVKQLGWLVRDAAGLERNLYSAGINSKGLSVDLVSKIAGYRGRIEAGWGALHDLTTRQGASARVVAAVQGATDNYFGSLEEQRRTLHAALLAGQQPPISLTDWLRISTAGLDSLIQVPNAAVVEAEAYAERRETDATRRLWLQLGLLLLGVLLGSGGLLFVHRRVTRPINAITATMRCLADGDMTIAIGGQDRHDEIGSMAKAVGVFKQNAIERVRLEAEQKAQEERAALEKQAAMIAMADKIEAATGGALATIASRTASMAATADEMHASAARTGTSAETAAAAAGQALANAQTVASAAEQLASSIREIGSQVSQSSAVVARAVDAGNATRKTIEALNEQVGKIGAVADIIGEIAAKTNLLALNATIEAARAGEAGKGFAVVASEVKALATQTAHSTQEIARHINEVRAATGASVTAVRQIEQTITEVDAIAGSIAAAVEEQGAATAEIARNVTETATAANDMTARVADVSAEALETGRRAIEVRDNSSALTSAMEDLRHAVIRVVRTSTSDVDRRGSPRYPVDLTCRLSTPGQATQTVHVLDLSMGGASVQGGPPLNVGDGGTLDLDGVGCALRFTVRASADGIQHLAFLTLDAATAKAFAPVLERLTRRLAA